jgi:hypothetical protein
MQSTDMKLFRADVADTALFFSLYLDFFDKETINDQKVKGLLYIL